ncbi:hypothetical protein HGRIS_002818 [Hohenbuehelia grisea]|uniref:Uncharacterized protein n=1 Tax=Hohenbuehelia grisea TaxID=104357 RepID=A0ABR3JME2_9AGAR
MVHILSLSTLVASLASAAIAASIPTSATHIFRDSEDPLALHGIAGFKWPSQPLPAAVQNVQDPASALIETDRPSELVSSTILDGGNKRSPPGLKAPLFRDCTSESEPGAGSWRNCVARSLKL